MVSIWLQEIYCGLGTIVATNRWLWCTQGSLQPHLRQSRVSYHILQKQYWDIVSMAFSVTSKCWLSLYSKVQPRARLLNLPRTVWFFPSCGGNFIARAEKVNSWFQRMFASPDDLTVYHSGDLKRATPLCETLISFAAGPVRKAAKVFLNFTLLAESYVKSAKSCANVRVFSEYSLSSCGWILRVTQFWHSNYFCVCMATLWMNYELIEIDIFQNTFALPQPKLLMKTSFGLPYVLSPNADGENPILLGEFPD